LEELARKLGERARQRRKSVTLNPMSPRTDASSTSLSRGPIGSDEELRNGILPETGDHSRRQAARRKPGWRPAQGKRRVSPAARSCMSKIP
jgi:hypothetical protein